MKHKHHDMIVHWAANPNRKVMIKNRAGKWIKVIGSVLWNEAEEYCFADELPKPKVKLYQWAIRHNNHWMGTGKFYKDEQQVKNDLLVQSQECIRLDYTMIEVDDTTPEAGK